MNILKNALLYSVEQKPVIELKASEKLITISVSNDGQLLSSEEQLQLFRHLFRGANSSQVKGFGLGLVLTRRIIDLHQGEIKYSVSSDNKNCFSVSLPTSA
jgi:signal transduction histidine kinase